MPTEPTTDALLDHTFRRWDMLLHAWNFYLLVGIGVILLFVLSEKARTNRRAYWVFQIGFQLFAFTHLLGLLYILKSWAALGAMSKAAIRFDPTLLENSGIIDAPEPIWVLPFHLLGDVFVFLAVRWLAKPQS
ncbi:MAG: hypothetical protein ACRC8S_06030 [Fimbriiglobus sp.]